MNTTNTNTITKIAATTKRIAAIVTIVFLTLTAATLIAYLGFGAEILPLIVASLASGAVAVPASIAYLVMMLISERMVDDDEEDDD